MDSRLQDKIRAGESKVLEFKEILPQGDKIAKTVVAFSNTSGGQLIIGVGDDRTIKGIDPDVDIFALQDRVVSIIYDLCYPNILPDKRGWQIVVCNRGLSREFIALLFEKRRAESWYLRADRKF